MALPSHKRASWRVLFVFAAALVFAASWQGLGAEQSEKELWPAQRRMNGFERASAKGWLEDAHRQLKKNYYDSTFHGVDVDARYQTYLQQVEQATSFGEVYRLINDYLAGLGDAQTFFVAPGDDYLHENGYRMAVIGDRCFVADVRPGSDAATKLHPGDQVLSIDGRPVSRTNFWDVRYLVSLDLKPATELALLSPAGTPRLVRVATARKGGAAGGDPRFSYTEEGLLSGPIGWGGPQN